MNFSYAYAMYAVLALVNVGVSYALLVFLASNLSKEDYALYGLLTTIMSLGLIVGNFGHKEAVFKFAAERRFENLLNALSSFSTWSLFFVSLSSLTLLFDLTTGTAAFAFYALLCVTLVNAYNRGHGRYTLDAVALPIYRGLWLCGSIGVTYFAVQLTTFHVFFAALLAALITFCVVGRYQCCLRALKSIRSFSLPWSNPTLIKFLMIEFATVAYLKVDILLLNYFDIGESVIAEYFLSTQIFEAAVLLLTPLGFFFFNQSAKLMRETKNRNNNGVIKTLSKYVVILISFAALGHLIWYLIGQWLLETMFSKYLDSYELILFLLFTLYPLVANIILSNFMILQHSEKHYMVICFVGLATNLVFNISLLSSWGVHGAIFSRFVTEAIMVLLIIVYLKRVRLI